MEDSEKRDVVKFFNFPILQKIYFIRYNNGTKCLTGMKFKGKIYGASSFRRLRNNEK